MLYVLFCTLLAVGCEFHSLTPVPSELAVTESRAGDAQPLADYAPVLTEVLAEVVTDDGRVRYQVLRGSRRDDFRRVLKTIETFDATTLRTDAEKLAFWMNAYNVQMLQHIIETPQVQNIVEDGYTEAFFRTPYRTAGLDMTLDQLENVILRRQDGPPALMDLQVDALDYRIHVGVNCAATSCPRLRQRAFTPANVEAELDDAMRDFANGPAHVRVEGSTIVLSSLLDWFGADFDQGPQLAGDVLLGYMAPDRLDYAALRAALKGQAAADLRALPNVRFEYLWTVNRAD